MIEDVYNDDNEAPWVAGRSSFDGKLNLVEVLSPTTHYLIHRSAHHEHVYCTLIHFVITVNSVLCRSKVFHIFHRQFLHTSPMMCSAFLCHESGNCSCSMVAVNSGEGCTAKSAAVKPISAHSCRWRRGRKSFEMKSDNPFLPLQSNSAQWTRLFFVRDCVDVLLPHLTAWRMSAGVSEERLWFALCRDSLWYQLTDPNCRATRICGSRLWLSPKVGLHKLPHYPHNYHAVPICVHALPLASHWQHSFVQNTSADSLRPFSSVCQNSKENISWTVLPLLTVLLSWEKEGSTYTSQLVRPMIFPSFWHEHGSTHSSTKTLKWLI